ncbi:MAG TPA: hypothetical protein VFV99_20630 [Kofleriaceae bacterium]|nr:hypothetical protein [Kofleriaceae bacterium]
MRCWLVVAALAGCSFEHGMDVGGGGDDVPPDVAPSLRDIPHVPATHEMPGIGDYMFTNTTIDTTTGTIQPPAPEGVVVAMVMQEPSGDELLVIRAHAISIPAATAVTVTGTRPLVLIADTITIAGLLDGSAHASVPGPGGMGATAVTKTGRGSDGVHTGASQDSGGGGGAYATNGATGGASGTATSCGSELANGGAGGQSWGTPTLDVLAGGAAGGIGSAVSCTPPPIGAGGGAIQVSAFTSLAITGAVNAGGGGGGMGLNCGTNDGSAASGGGSGGAIYLDAPLIELAGVIAANGGGGGGGGSSPGTNGSVGGDGLPSTMYASGGAAGGSYGANGGRGGIGTAGPTAGGNHTCDGNAGGGGGSVGYIVMHAKAGGVSGTGVQSPAATLDTTGF